MSQQKRTTILLVCITLLGAYFRFLNINWDEGYGFHPDERNIALAVQEVTFPKQFNPKFYAYGTVPIYTMRVITQTLQSITGNPSWTEDLGYITYIGRLLSSFASILTIPAVFLLAQSVTSPSVSLLTALITATTPLLIQYAHFSVTESAITLYAILIAYLSILWHTSRRYSLILCVGILLGIAIATKVSTITYMLFPFTAIYLSWQSGKRPLQHKKNLLFPLAYLLVAIACVYIILSSITFIYPLETLESLLYERDVALGTNIVFYTYQFFQTSPYIFHIAQFPKTIGYPMTVLAVLGLLLQLYLLLRKPKARYVIVFLWTLVYTLLVGSWFTKFVRYLIPVYPFFIIAGSLFIEIVLLKTKKAIFQYLIIGTLVMVQLLQAIAFSSIYIVPQTRLQALTWIYSQTPDHSILLADDASEFLPSTPPEAITEETKRQVQSVPHFGLESDEAIASLAQNLAQSDYYVIGTRRQYGVVKNHPYLFPKTARFYEALFSGFLGYTIVAQFVSYPSLTIGTSTYSFPDDAAEETLQVFDHPTIYIFQNTAHVDEETIFDMIR